MKCTFEKTALEAALTKIKDSVSEVETNPQLRFILLKVAEKEVRVRASNLQLTTEVRVPLYEPTANIGEIALVYRDLADIVKCADPLLSLESSETHMVTVKTKGYEWVLRGVASFALGDEFKPTGDAPPTMVSREDLLRSLRVCESCMSTDASARGMYGINFTAKAVEATDGHRIAFYLKSLGLQCTIPSPAVATTKTLLEYGAVEKVGIRMSGRQVELTVGADWQVYGQMNEPFADMSKLTKDLVQYQPMFEADKESFILGVKRSGVLGDEKTTITISRSGEDLQFTALRVAEKIGEGLLRVTWKTPEPNFSIKLNWKVFKDIIGVLDGEVVKFGVGTLNGNNFVRLDESDRNLFVLSLIK